MKFYPCNRQENPNKHKFFSIFTTAIGFTMYDSVIFGKSCYEVICMCSKVVANMILRLTLYSRYHLILETEILDYTINCLAEKFLYLI